jgi:hypothetical protein
VTVRWKFSDEALRIGVCPLIVSEARYDANRWLD